MKFQSFIYENGSGYAIGSERSDWMGELETMTRKTAERLMLRGDINSGAWAHIIESDTGRIVRGLDIAQIKARP